MKRLILLFAFMSCVISCLWSQSDGFKITEIFPIDAAHSYVGFSIRYMGYAMVRGRFTDLRGAIRFNEKELAQTSVTLMIDVNSINTGDTWRDDDLKSENWFDGKKYPRIFFVSRKAEAAPGGLRITGDLTICGITKSVTIHLDRPMGVVKDVRDDSQIIFTGELTLNRIEFGVEGKKWAGIKEGITAVSDDVNIELTILGKRINAGNFKYWVANVTTPHGKIYRTAKTRGIDKALLAFDSTSHLPNSKLDAEALNTSGQMLLKENKVQEAMVLFKKNIEMFPGVSLVYESYGEALAVLGKWEEALKFYKLAIEKDKENMNAREVIRHIPK